MAVKHRITINLDDKEYQELVELSKSLDVSLAWLGRRAFSDLLTRHEQDIKQVQANDPVTKIKNYN